MAAAAATVSPAVAQRAARAKPPVRKKGRFFYLKHNDPIVLEPGEPDKVYVKSAPEPGGTKRNGLELEYRHIKHQSKLIKEEFKNRVIVLEEPVPEDQDPNDAETLRVVRGICYSPGLVLKPLLEFVMLHKDPKPANKHKRHVFPLPGPTVFSEEPRDEAEEEAALFSMEDIKFINKFLNDFGVDALIELIKTAKFLDLTHLYYVATSRLAVDLMTRSADDIRKRYDLASDWKSPEDQKAAEGAYRWLQEG